ncbi:MAG: hypothetical protein OEZ34_10700 [Spirochaetia bacterium]|nr:hypothetical protein [Spirochaetia bacterium]
MKDNTSQSVMQTEVEHDVERPVDSSPRKDWSTGQAECPAAIQNQINA